jgi:hypothetical protein
MFLDIPEPKRTTRRSNRLGETKVSILQEAERKFIVLTDRNQGPSRIQTLQEAFSFCPGC